MSETTEKNRIGRPTELAPREEETRIILWASEVGGWVAAVRHEGRWWDFPYMETDLTDYAECWEHVLPDPDRL